ncbi:hypothetical protein MRX96_012224 [Rhipicephalus microplus]
MVVKAERRPWFAPQEIEMGRPSSPMTTSREGPLALTFHTEPGARAHGLKRRKKAPAARRGGALGVTSTIPPCQKGSGEGCQERYSAAAARDRGSVNYRLIYRPRHISPVAGKEDPILPPSHLFFCSPLLTGRGPYFSCSPSWHSQGAATPCTHSKQTAGRRALPFDHMASSAAQSHVRRPYLYAVPMLISTTWRDSIYGGRARGSIYYARALAW